jgi:hypothetical protein
MPEEKKFRRKYLRAVTAEAMKKKKEACASS